MPGRDHLEFLKLVAEHCMLSVSQLADLLGTSAQGARRKIRQYNALLAKTSYPLSGKTGRPETIIAPGPKAIALLKQANDFHSIAFKGDPFSGLQHQISLNGFRLCFYRLAGADLSTQFIAANSPFRLDEHGRSSLRERVPIQPRGEGERLFVPDAACAITSVSRKSSLLCFVEIDMGTETLCGRGPTDIRTKILNYRTYLGRRLYAKFEDLFATRFKGFRVLFVTSTQRRMKQMCRLVREMKPSDFAWITDYQSATSAGLGAAIWARGGHDDKPLQSLLGSLAPKAT